MTPETATRPRVPVRHINIRWWWPLVAIVAIVAAVVVAKAVGSSPKTVSQVTIVNNTGYDVGVDVARGQGDGRLPVGPAGAHSTTDFRQVIDQGPEWVFRFVAQGRDVGETRINRDDLAHANWRMVIPATVEHRLRDAGAPPSPTRT